MLSDTPSLSSSLLRSAWLRAVYEALRAVVVCTTICGGGSFRLIYIYDTQKMHKVRQTAVQFDKISLFLHFCNFVILGGKRFDAKGNL